MLVVTPFGSLNALPPFTLNRGASFGPRISTAGFEHWERHAGTLHVRLYAELDGELWQDDGDVLRRGAQALVPFCKRFPTLSTAPSTSLCTDPLKNQDDWFRTTLVCNQESEGFDRRMVGEVDFRAPPHADLDELEQQCVERFRVIVKRMGEGLHVALHDPRNSRAFASSRAA